MKRYIALLLALILLLPGCHRQKAEDDTVTFYYRRSEVQYGSADSIIAAEERTLSGDLTLLLSAYFRGPEDDSLILPFPAGTRLLETVQKDSTLTLTLSSEFSQLEGMDLTVACACISSTCFAITEAHQVKITTPAIGDTPSSVFTLTRDSLLLFDEVQETTEADPQ